MVTPTMCHLFSPKIGKENVVWGEFGGVEGWRGCLPVVCLL